jgi:hypothetical protein
VELKQLITHFTYRIEPKPEGGFIAHASDPTVAPLEAPTRQELQQKIQATIVANLGAQFPTLKSAIEGQTSNFAFHIERKPGGGFILHSGQDEPIEVGTHDDLEGHVAEKLVNFVGKHFAPELAQALATQGTSGDIKVTVNRKIGFGVKAGSHSLSFGQNPSGQAQLDGANVEDAKPAIFQGDAKLGDIGQSVRNQPITPESSGNWTMFFFLMLLMTVGAIVYILLRR